MVAHRPRVELALPLRHHVTLVVPYHLLIVIVLTILMMICQLNGSRPTVSTGFHHWISTPAERLFVFSGSYLTMKHAISCVPEVLTSDRLHSMHAVTESLTVLSSISEKRILRRCRRSLSANRS